MLGGNSDREAWGRGIGDWEVTGNAARRRTTGGGEADAMGAGSWAIGAGRGTSSGGNCGVTENGRGRLAMSGQGDGRGIGAILANASGAMSEACGERGRAGDGSSGIRASDGSVGRAVTASVSAGVGDKPSLGERATMSSGSIIGSSGAGGTGSSGLWAGGTRGLTVGATGGINGARGRGWSGAGAVTAADRTWESDAAGSKAGVVKPGCGTDGTNVGGKAGSAGIDGRAAGACGTWQTGAVGMGETDNIGGGRGAAAMSAGGMLTGEGVGDRATLLGGGHEAANTGCSGPAGSGQSDEAGERRRVAAGTCGRQVWTSNCGAAGAGGNGVAELAGGVIRGGDRRTSSTAWDIIRAGTGGWGDEGVMGAAGSGGSSGAEGKGIGSNEAGKDAGARAYSYCGYKLLIAALNSCQDSGSSNVSRVADHVSQDSSFV